MALLKYDLEVVGMSNVERALAGLESRLQAHNARVTQMTRGAGAGPGRRRLVDPAATGRVAAPVDKAARDAERLEKQRERTRRSIRLNTIEQERRDRVRAERETERDEKRAAKRRETALRSESRLVKQAAHQRAAFVKATIGSSADRVMGATKAIGYGAMGMLGIGGAAMGAAAVGQASRLDEMTRRIIVNSREAGAVSQYNPEDLRKQITRTGIQTGVDPEQVAAGAARFVSVTGSIGGAVDRMKALSTFTMATGASMDELAGIAGSLFNNGITSVDGMTQALATMVFQGKKASFELKDMAQFMPGILAKGSTIGLGGVEGAAKLGGFLQIAMSGTQNAAEAATATERMLDALVTNADKMASGEAFGGKGKVNVYTDKSRKHMRDATQLVPEILAATGGDIGQMFKIMDIRGSRATNKMLAEYTRAADATPGTEKEKKAAGAKAVAAMISEFSDVKGGYADIQRDAADAMKSFSVQMEIFNTRIKDVIASNVFPELQRLAPELVKLIPYVKEGTKAFVDLIKAFAENPLTNIGKVVAVLIAADFAKARIGSLVSSLIVRAFSGRAPIPGGGGVGGVGVGGGVGGAAAPGVPGGVPGKMPWAQRNMYGGGKLGSATTWGGALGAAGTGLAIGAVGAAAIYGHGVSEYHGGEARMSEGGANLREVERLGGDFTDPAQVKDAAAQARAAVDEQRKRVNAAKFENSGFTGWMSNFITGGQGEVEQKTQESILARMEERAQKLDSLAQTADGFKGVPDGLTKAAAALSEAAVKLGLVQPNRSNAPTATPPGHHPVKP